MWKSEPYQCALYCHYYFALKPGLPHTPPSGLGNKLSKDFPIDMFRSVLLLGNVLRWFIFMFSDKINEKVLENIKGNTLFVIDCLFQTWYYKYFYMEVRKM